MNNSRSDRRAPRALAAALAATFCTPAAFAADVAPDLLAATRNGARADALIVFADAAPVALAPLAPNADVRLRRRALVDALRARADASQRDVRAWLDANGVAYRAFWISNVVSASLDANALAALAARGDVARIEADRPIRAPLPVPQVSTDVPRDVETVEWGVAAIHAPEVWAAGTTGQGVVIAGEDTGYRWDHPALKPHYRGWDGANADHNYNWHDSIHAGSAANACNFDTTEPCDDHGHGTHTAGTFAGDDGNGHQVGVAPGARWVGCRNMDAGDGTPARYIECMQWMLAPTDLAGANANPDLAPDVVSNSWGCPLSEGCTAANEIKQAVDNVVAGGIFFAAAAGNDGNGCASILDAPAIYDSAFVVASSTQANTVSSFSSRGPVAGASRVLPDVAAPGSSVRSAYPPATYATLSGTSMATPHVAGTVALLISVNPALRGHPDRLAAILRATTVPLDDTQTCDAIPPTTFPNPVQGSGRIDAFAAFRVAETIFTHAFDD